MKTLERIRKSVVVLMMSIVGILSVSAADAPTYPGGEKAMKEFIAKTMKYPEASKANGVEGVIPLNVTINADGSIGAIKIMRMVDPDLEQEAIRIVKSMPAWEPATKDGQPVVSQTQLSISFVLE